MEQFDKIMALEWCIAAELGAQGRSKSADRRLTELFRPEDPRFSILRLISRQY